MTADDIAKSLYRGGAEFEGIAARAHTAMFDENILAKSGSRFETNAIIFGIDVTAANDHIGTAIDINPIIGDSGARSHLDVFDENIRAFAIKLHPTGALQQSDLADGDLVALSKVNDGWSFGFVIARQFACLVKLHGILCELDTLSIDNTLARNGDVALVVREDEPVKIDFPIEESISATEQHCAFLQMQCDVAAQCNRASQKSARRNDHRATTRCGCGINRLLNETAVQRYAIAFRSELGNGKIAGGMQGRQHEPEEEKQATQMSLVVMSVNQMHGGQYAKQRCHLSMKSVFCHTSNFDVGVTISISI